MFKLLEGKSRSSELRCVETWRCVIYFIEKKRKLKIILKLTNLKKGKKKSLTLVNNTLTNCEIEQYKDFYVWKGHYYKSKNASGLNRDCSTFWLQFMSERNWRIDWREKKVVENCEYRSLAIRIFPKEYCSKKVQIGIKSKNGNDIIYKINNGLFDQMD